MEDVILEYIDSENMEKVAVLPFDLSINEVCGPVIEVTTRTIAEKDYNVVGYLIDGELNISDEYEDSEPDYYEMFGYEEDDD